MSRLDDALAQMLWRWQMTGGPLALLAHIDQMKHLARRELGLHISDVVFPDRRRAATLSAGVCVEWRCG